MRSVRRLLWSVLIGLVAFEVVLQLAALVVSLTAAPGSASGAAAGRVLCIGDSYTYGLGSTATANSYPGVLQRLLRECDAAAPAVVNAGWPGLNSREALLRLDAQLAEYTPALVCVLIGLNDSWTRPAPVTGAELDRGEAAGFTWRYRTWRLLALLWRSAPELPSAPAVAAAVPDPAAPAASAPSGSQTMASAAAELVQSGRHGEAIALLERAAVDDPANAPEYHQGLVQIRTALGQRDAALRSLQWLRNRYETAPDRAVEEALATALHSTGEREQAATLAVAGVARYPGSSTLWWIASQHHYDIGDLQAAERELDRAIATAAPGNQVWLAVLHRERARACCRRDLTSALRSMLTAMHIDRDVDRCRLIVEGEPEAFTKPALERSLAEIGPGPEDLELLQRLLGSGWAERSGMCDVLQHNLEQIVRRCQARGCGVVVLGYPLAVADLAAVQQRVAHAAKVAFVPCQPAFVARLQTVSREALYIRDGHCNDAGYALMAEIVLPTVLAALAR